MISITMRKQGLCGIGAVLADTIWREPVVFGRAPVITHKHGATPMMVIAATPFSLDAIPPRRTSVELTASPKEEDMAHLRGIVAKYRDSGVRFLVDLREDDTTQVAGENVEAFASFLGTLAHEGLRRVGIVAGPQPEHHALARMVETYVDRAGLEAACFHNPDDAMGWVRS